MLSTLEMYPIEKCQRLLGIDQVTLFMFCLGSGWRLPTDAERWNMYKQWRHECPQLSKAWTLEVLEKSYAHEWAGYVIPVRTV